MLFKPRILTHISKLQNICLQNTESGRSAIWIKTEKKCTKGGYCLYFSCAQSIEGPFVPFSLQTHKMTLRMPQGAYSLI